MKKEDYKEKIKKIYGILEERQGNHIHAYEFSILLDLVSELIDQLVIEK